MEGVRNLCQRDKMELHVLPGGEVALAAGTLVGDRAELAHLSGSKQAAGDFRADHLDAILALAVDAAAEAVGAEFVDGQPAGEKLLSLGPKEFDIRANGAIVFLLKDLLVIENVRSSHTLIPYRDYTTSPRGAWSR
jgi:hypothetical protein